MGFDRSGGADSAFLAFVAHDTLGSSNVLSVTAVSPSLAPEEEADCKARIACGMAVTSAAKKRAQAAR